MTPLIHLNNLIPATSNVFSSAFINANFSAPYIIAGLTTFVNTFPLPLKLILLLHRTPGTFFSFSILIVLYALSPHPSLHSKPMSLYVFKCSHSFPILSPCRLTSEFPSKLPSPLYLTVFFLLIFSPLSSIAILHSPSLFSTSLFWCYTIQCHQHITCTTGIDPLSRRPAHP